MTLPEPENTKWIYTFFDFGNKIALTISVKFGKKREQYSSFMMVMRPATEELSQMRAKNYLAEGLKKRFWRKIGAA